MKMLISVRRGRRRRAGFELCPFVVMVIRSLFQSFSQKSKVRRLRFAILEDARRDGDGRKILRQLTEHLLHTPVILGTEHPVTFSWRPISLGAETEPTRQSWPRQRRYTLYFDAIQCKKYGDR